ncbi:exported hypothetical protein [Mesorhizobium metallidurans STM 2683]|uniref:Uncharacterized protein n=1 Tax=Mesorhizobium metallidurans STM 2683 TaxID=1297569 RepID=M5EGV9_9HYPH|nr:exported hypothetical protein [Mesorhizobium metallidurans STM 2683]
MLRFRQAAAALAWSSGFFCGSCLAGGLDVFSHNGGYITITGKIAALGFGQPGFYLGELPFFTGYKVLNGLRSHIGSRAVELFGKLVKPVRGFVRDAHGKSRHGHNFHLVHYDY